MMWTRTAAVSVVFFVLLGAGFSGCVNVDLAAQDVTAEAAARELGRMKASTSPEQVYATWNRFCRAHFGAEKEPLVYDLYGKDLQVTEGGDWTHVSANSACVGRETNLPATVVVEYGETSRYGARTGPSERPFYIHVHYLKDLKPDTTYHYRVVATDERGRKITSKDATFTTAAPQGAVLFPAEDQAGPPYILDKANTTYVLTKDITAKGTAIEVTAPDVTIDLNGHTVVYHDETIPKEVFTDKYMTWVHKGAVGIKNFGQPGITILGGTIRQGRGTNAGNVESTGFIPVYMRNPKKVLIAGVTVDYWTSQNTGMRLRKALGDVEIHHCVFLDRGCKIRNRHGAAVRSLSLTGREGTNYRAHHNLVKRTRQMGILGPDELAHNEIYTDSWSVNSFALAPWGTGGVAHHNRIFGTGVNVQGFGWGKNDCAYRHNLIHMEGIDTGKNRGKEGWGDRDSMNGFRVTNYGKGGQVRHNLRYGRNTVIIRCRGASQARGTEFFSDETITDLVCDKAVIKVEVLDEATDQVACVVTHGHAAKADTCLPVWYRDCTLLSNLCIVRMGDYYGKGSNHHFIRCKLRRIGEDPRFHTFIVDGAYWSKRHVFLDCDFGPGGAFDDVLWKRTSWKSFYSIAWTLTVKCEPDAKVTIKDNEGKVVFEGTADDDGKVAAELMQCTVRPPRKLKCPSTEKLIEVRTPHTVIVTKDGKTATKTVEMTKTQELAVTF